jgi:hypothetical protein
VDHGRVTEEGGRLRTFQRRRLDEPDVDLHLLAEPSGVKGEELAAQALDAIGRLFLQDRLSLTGGLQRALLSTHQTLIDWNRRSVPREQVSAGISAAIVSGQRVFLAQLGPSLVYLRRDGRLERLLPGEEAGAGLGEGELSPAPRSIDLAQGDILLAASVALEKLLDQDTVDALLSRGSDEAMPELYLLTRDLPNFALFAISCHELEDDDATSPFEAEIPDHLRARVEPGGLNSVSQMNGLQTEAPPALLVAEEEVAEAPLASLPPLDISRSVVRLRSDPSLGRTDYPLTTGAAPRFRINISQPGLLALIGGLAVLFFVGAFTVPDLIREGRSERIALLLDSGQSQLVAAQAEEDPARRRALLEETSRLASEVLRIDSLNAIASDLRQEASSHLTVMDAVFDLGPLTTVTTLGRELTGEVSIEGLTVAANTAYLVDERGGRVVAVPVNGSGPPSVIFEEGETYGGTPAETPLYIAWEGSQQAGRLLVLDAERKLFSIRPGSSPEPLPLRRTNTWSSVAGLAAYDGNLYILDPAGDQVHRYLPAAVGFDSEPSTVVGSEDLGDAEGLAVDGDIFVYFEDGNLRRYRSGNDLGFGLGGIDRTPKTLTAISVLPLTEEVYLADSSNKRVVVASKDGTFRRQLVSNAFTDLRALALDPIGGNLYVVVGDALLTAPIVR